MKKPPKPGPKPRAKLALDILEDLTLTVLEAQEAYQSGIDGLESRRQRIARLNALLGRIEEARS